MDVVDEQPLALIERAGGRKRKLESAVVDPRNLKKKRVGNGTLAELMNVPMDVLFEVSRRLYPIPLPLTARQIFGHLRPLDILHLARTTKEFRCLLMNRSASYIWKAARLNVPGLPDCPPDLTEPQWANLAFSQFCHVSL